MLSIGQPIRVQLKCNQSEKWVRGQIIKRNGPREYDIKVEDRVIKRNRIHIRPAVQHLCDAAEEHILNEFNNPRVIH